ncbi:putative oligopeptide transporter [Smittium culicis]|uniref:Putative oligopeptide transporter n=1 Tax=Smittium culicis TaxID=133412 RepID=A0A1R1X1N8_9FUNG|nr:putative oligopeptide transporter [Smittium culicis]
MSDNLIYQAQYTRLSSDTLSVVGRITESDQVEKSHFTWRAVLVGLFFGTLLCFSNMYFGLQTGWISMMSLQSSLVGFAVFKVMEPLLNKKFSIYENVLVQTTSVAAATMPLAGGFVGILPAFNMLTKEEIGDNLLLGTDIYRLIMWGFGLSLFGVFFAILLRKQLLIKEKLRFPSGSATAEMIAVLHNKKSLELSILDQITNENSQNHQSLPPPTLSQNSAIIQYPRILDSIDADDESDSVDEPHYGEPSDWKFKIYLLFVSFTISSIYTIVANIYPSINKVPIFGYYLSDVWLWNLRPSFSFAGQGIIMGLPTTAHMLLGAIVGWGILSPLAKLKDWAPGPVSDWKTGSRGWILWVSLAVMVSESLTSLSIMVLEESYAALTGNNKPASTPPRRLMQHQNGESPESNLLTVTHQTSVTNDIYLSTNRSNHVSDYASNDDNVNNTDSDDYYADKVISNKTAWIGLIVSTLACALIMQNLLLIPIIKTILAVVIACLLAVLSVRALGKTDLNPVSGIGKISQIIFAYLMPRNLIGNLVAGAVAEAGAMQAGDLMQDLKTGHLIGANPNAQFFAQFIGSVFSVFVSAYAYKLYTKLYEIPGPVFAVPTAQVWLDMARLVNGELLPPYCREFSFYFGLFFGLVVVVQKLSTMLTFINSYSNSSYIIPQYISNSYFMKLFQDFSGMAFAIGIYNTPDFTLARFFGALFVEIFIYLFYKNQQKNNLSAYATYTSAKQHLMPFIIIIASGFVLGEGATAFAILFYDNTISSLKNLI